MSERISDEMLSAYFDGEASPEEAALIECSLESNPELVKKLDEWKALRRAIEHLPTYRTSDGMHLTIMSAIAKGQSGAVHADSNMDALGGDASDSEPSEVNDPSESSVGPDKDVMTQALHGNAPRDPRAEVPPATDSPRHWRWAIGLFATVAAVVLIAIFYNPTQFRVDPNQVARDETSDDYRTARDRVSEGLSTSGDDAGAALRSESLRSESLRSESLPAEPNSEPKAESMMQLSVPQGQRPPSDADASLGPGGGFGGGGKPLQKSAGGQPAGGTPLVPSPEERQFGGIRDGQSGGGEQKGGGVGQANQPHEPATSPRGGGGRAPMERSANAPAEQNANPQSRMVAPGRGGRGVGNSEPTPEGRQSDDVDSESPAPPAQMMMRTADANEAGGNRENRALQGRFYAVIDFDVQAPFTLNEQRATDFAGEDAAAEEQNDRRSEKNQDDLQLADTTRPALPILLEQLGFVQVERLREKDQQPPQRLGIVEQMAVDHDRESYFRFKQDLPAPQAMMAQADQVQADSVQADQIEVAPVQNDNRPLPPSSGDGPSTLAIDAEESGDAAEQVRVEFYEFEADADDVNQLIAQLAERGVDVNLFFSQPVGNGIAGSRAAPDTGVVRGGVESIQSFNAANLPPENARSKPTEPESSGGGDGAPEDVASQPAEAATANTAVEATAGQGYNEQLERLGWDAVEMRPLLETRTAELAMMQQGQRFSDQIQPNAGGETGEGQPLGRSAFGSPETRQSRGAGEPSQPQRGQDEPADANRADDEGGVNAPSSTPALENLMREQEQLDELGGAAGKRMTLDELSRSRTSYFWQGQSYVESNVAVDATPQDQAGNHQLPQVAPPTLRVRPPRPTPQDEPIESLPDNRTRIGNGDAQGATPTGNPIGQELNRLIPQFSRAGRVRLTLVVRTPIVSSQSSEENANPSPINAESDEQEPNSTKSESNSGNNR